MSPGTRPQTGRGRSKADSAAAMLESAIVNCDLKPGSVLREAELVAMLGLGRTPVREALVRLSSENLVRLSRAGILIPEINAITMLKLLELREPIERICIEKACLRKTESDVARLGAIRDRIAPLTTDNRSAFMAILRESHHAIAEASKNEFVHATLKTTQGLSRRFWRYFATDEDQAYAMALYEALLGELIAGNRATALGHSARLIGYLRQFTRRQMDELAWGAGAAPD